MGENKSFENGKWMAEVEVRLSLISRIKMWWFCRSLMIMQGKPVRIYVPVWVTDDFYEEVRGKYVVIHKSFHRAELLIAPKWWYPLKVVYWGRDRYYDMMGFVFRTLRDRGWIDIPPGVMMRWRDLPKWWKNREG